MTRAEFDALLLEARGPLFKYAMSLTHDQDLAEDLVQETMLRAIRFWRLYRPMDVPFRSWAFRIERNAFLSSLKTGDAMSRVSKVVSVFPDEETEFEVSPTVSGNQEDRLLAREMVAAIKRIAPVYRQALEMAVMRGWSCSEIAAHLGIREGTVKSRVSRARDMIAAMIDHKSERRRTW